MLSTQGFQAGRDLYYDTPAVTWGLGFPVSSEGPPQSVASYDTQKDLEYLFLSGSSRVDKRYDCTNGISFKPVNDKLLHPTQAYYKTQEQTSLQISGEGHGF
jgi:hypothetical protein